MEKTLVLAPAVAGLFVVLTCTTARAQFADSVVAYTPGSGVSTNYQHTDVVLGAPATFIGYQNADPFNPPYATNDIVGIGTGGSLTLAFNKPIQNNPLDPYGLDFIIFGHAGFIEDFDTATAVDGSLFTGGTANVRVSVSADGSSFFTLNPALAPAVDSLYPTDSSGSPFIPVNPSLTASDFAGKDLAGIRSLYNGSAGGAGFDLGWAVDGNNQSVDLPSISYVRLEDLSGTAFIDAVSAVPEPSALSLALLSGAAVVRRKRRTNA